REHRVQHVHGNVLFVSQSHCAADQDAPNHQILVHFLHPGLRLVGDVTHHHPVQAQAQTDDEQRPGDRFLHAGKPLPHDNPSFARVQTESTSSWNGKARGTEGFFHPATLSIQVRYFSARAPSMNSLPITLSNSLYTGSKTLRNASLSSSVNSYTSMPAFFRFSKLC